MKINGSKFAKKEFVCCSTKEEFVNSYKDLSERHRASINDLDGYEIGRGKIIAVIPTFMTWGILKIYPNTENKRNMLRNKGYTEIK